MKELNFEDYISNIEYYNKKYKQTIKGFTHGEDNLEEVEES